MKPEIDNREQTSLKKFYESGFLTKGEFRRLTVSADQYFLSRGLNIPYAYFNRLAQTMGHQSGIFSMVSLGMGRALGRYRIDSEIMDTKIDDLKQAIQTIKTSERPERTSDQVKDIDPEAQIPEILVPFKFEADEKDIFEMRVRGLRYADIAAYFGTNPESIRSRFRRFKRRQKNIEDDKPKNPRKPETIEFDERVKKLRQDGLIYDEIAVKLDVPVSRIRVSILRMMETGELPRKQKVTSN